MTPPQSSSSQRREAATTPSWHHARAWRQRSQLAAAAAAAAAVPRHAAHCPLLPPSLPSLCPPTPSPHLALCCLNCHSVAARCQAGHTLEEGGACVRACMCSRACVGGGKEGGATGMQGVLRGGGGGLGNGASWVCVGRGGGQALAPCGACRRSRASLARRAGLGLAHHALVGAQVLGGTALGGLALTPGGARLHLCVCGGRAVGRDSWAHARLPCLPACTPPPLSPSPQTPSPPACAP